ncbi:MAG: glycosyltransferase family 4 protein [Spirochaetes bacterium]|nr:glycosyltransferase family 4 protein [Spirochaetota bacterium]
MGKSNLKEIPILHINDAVTWRGGEKQTFYLTRHLNSRGYISLCVCRRDSVLHKKLEEENLPYFPLKMRSEFDIFSAAKIAKYAEKNKTGIIHMHTSHAHSIGLLTNLFHRFPVNIVSRRVDFRVKSHFLNRIKYSFPDRFITVSGAIREILIEDGIPAGKISAVHSGVDLEQYSRIQCDYLFEEFARIPGLRDKIKIINTAALTHQKDHETLIRAMDIVLKSRRDAVLFIAGEGELESRLKKLSSGLGLNENIIFTGFRNDPLSLIKFCDFFVLSSRWEGLGTSVIDAMALGKPVIACSTGGTPELISDGINGMLVEKENPLSLAGAILKLAGDTDLRKKYGSEAIRKASDFSIERTVERTIDVYRECLNSNLD